MLSKDAHRLSFEDALLDWASAEALSPTMWDRGYSALGEELRDRIAAEGCEHLAASERQLLIGALQHVRGPLLRAYRINAGCRFTRQSVSSLQLAKFEILPQLECGPITLHEFSERLRLGHHAEHAMMRRAAEAMLSHAAAGARFPGHPVAVVRAQGLIPVLIEGYKRALVALWQGTRSSVDVILAEPPTLGS